MLKKSGGDNTMKIGGNMSESHIKPYVWDQLELVRMLTDLYIKDNDLRDGQSDGVLATPQRLRLKEEINIQTALLVNKTNAK